MFDSRENERNEKKMREKKIAGKLLPNTISIPVEKNENPCTRFDLSLYSAQISKNTKIPSIPIIHEGKNWKNHKKEVKRGVKWTTGGLAGWNFRSLEEFRRLRNFATCKNFTAYQISFNAPFFPLLALLSLWDLICNDVSTRVLRV